MNEATKPATKKLVLFVDDTLETVAEHRQQVESDTGHPTWLCRILNAAKLFIDAHHAEIALVVIDVYMPGNLDLLMRDEPNTEPSSQGLLLGRYLHAKYNDLPYIYLSAFPVNFGDDNAKGIFSKHPDEMDKFLSRIKEFIDTK